MQVLIFSNLNRGRETLRAEGLLSVVQGRLGLGIERCSLLGSAAVELIIQFGGAYTLSESLHPAPQTPNACPPGVSTAWMIRVYSEH